MTNVGNNGLLSIVLRFVRLDLFFQKFKTPGIDYFPNSIHSVNTRGNARFLHEGHSLCFVDFRKAFCSISRKELFEILPLYGIPHSIVEAIKCLYTITTALVITPLILMHTPSFGGLEAIQHKKAHKLKNFSLNYVYSNLFQSLQTLNRLHK